MTIEVLWNRVLGNEGKSFYTVRGLEFDYEKVDYDKIKIYRDGKFAGFVTKDNMDFILNNPNLSRKEYRDVMWTSSYALSLYNTLIKMEKNQ